MFARQDERRVYLLRYAGVAPTDRHLRLVVDNRRPKDFRMYISPEEIRRGPRKRINWDRVRLIVGVVALAFWLAVVFFGKW